MVLSSGQGGTENSETNMKPGDQTWGLTTPSVHKVTEDQKLKFYLKKISTHMSDTNLIAVIISLILFKLFSTY